LSDTTWGWSSVSPIPKSELDQLSRLATIQSCHRRTNGRTNGRKDDGGQPKTHNTHTHKFTKDVAGTGAHMVFPARGPRIWSYATGRGHTVSAEPAASLLVKFKFCSLYFVEEIIKLIFPQTSDWLCVSAVVFSFGFHQLFAWIQTPLVAAVGPSVVRPMVTSRRLSKTYLYLLWKLAPLILLLHSDPIQTPQERYSSFKCWKCLQILIWPPVWLWLQTTAVVNRVWPREYVVITHCPFCSTSYTSSDTFVSVSFKRLSRRRRPSVMFNVGLDLYAVIALVYTERSA